MSNHRRINRFVISTLASAVGIEMMLFAGAAMAQTPSAAAVYEKSHTVATNIKGVTGFPDLPTGFDALNASEERLAAYGMPPRPDPAADPDNYKKWAKVMSQIGHAKHFAGPLKDMGVKSMPNKAGGKVSAAVEGVPQQVSSSNWSGIANTIALTTWNAKKSFYYVISDFNVPVAQQPFGSCDGGWDWEVSWNGIDGYSNGDVLQGGSSSAAHCASNVTTTSYCAWVEWYPSYPILCQFGVNPGDDMFVETYDTSPTNGYVFIYDETLNIYSTVNLVPTQPPYLVGNSAEYIVERPCCVGPNGYPLANYVQNFWAENYAYTFNGVLFTPSNTTTSTKILTMYDDGFTQPISYVPEIGAKYQIWFNDENCAYSGGCTP